MCRKTIKHLIAKFVNRLVTEYDYGLCSAGQWHSVYIPLSLLQQTDFTLHSSERDSLEGSLYCQLNKFPVLPRKCNVITTQCGQETCVNGLGGFSSLLS